MSGPYLRQAVFEDNEAPAATLCPHIFGSLRCGVADTYHHGPVTCDKTFECCRKFHNIQNFGGTPGRKPLENRND